MNTLLPPEKWMTSKELPVQPPIAPVVSSVGEAVTVAELDQLAAYLFALDDYIDGIKEYLTSLNKEMASAQATATRYLKELGREDYKSPVGNLAISEKWRVNLPKSDEDKAQLLQHLRDRGIFEKYVSVNSASLNALFMADWEAAKKRGEGVEFSMPGIDEPKLFEALSMRRARSKKSSSSEEV